MLDGIARRNGASATWDTQRELGNRRGGRNDVPAANRAHLAQSSGHGMEPAGTLGATAL